MNSLWPRDLRNTCSHAGTSSGLVTSARKQSSRLRNILTGEPDFSTQRSSFLCDIICACRQSPRSRPRESLDTAEVTTVPPCTLPQDWRHGGQMDGSRLTFDSFYLPSVFLINCQIRLFTRSHKCRQMSRKCQGLGQEGNSSSVQAH